MTGNIFKFSLTALFLSASLHAADASQRSAPVSIYRPRQQDTLPQSMYLNFNVRTEALDGQKAFCEQLPRECHSHMKPLRIHLTSRVYEAIANINVIVNRSIRPVEDLVQFNRSEVWSYPNSGAGDCEDYQLLKQKLLSAAGVPRSALRHAMVWDTRGEGHDVLIVRTDRGDFVLDNLSDEMRTLEQTGYRFVKVLSPSSDYAWKTWDAGKGPRFAFSAVPVDRNTVVELSNRTLATLQRTANGHNKTATSSLVR